MRPAIQKETDMRKIVAGLFISLDGVVEAPETWTAPYHSPEVDGVVYGALAAADTLLLGRRTYETFAAAFAGNTDPMAATLTSFRKVVVSTTLEKATSQNTSIIRDDVAAGITRLKAEPGNNIGISGSPTLVRWLLHQGLLDELNLVVCPIVAGRGMRLFEEEGEPVPLELVESAAFANGVQHLVYQPANVRQSAAA